MEVDKAAFQVAERRLAYLERAIADEENEVEAHRRSLEEALSAAQDLKKRYQDAVSPFQNRTYVGSLLSLVSWLFVFFVLENIEWYVGLAMAIALTFVARGFHRQWMEVERQLRSELRDAAQAVEQAETDLSEALARREDHILEQELCWRIVEKYNAANAAEQGNE